MTFNEKKVKLAIKGDQEALLFLLSQEKEKLYRTAYSYVRNQADALDAFQQTVLLAIESIHQLREPKYFTTWLMKICINVSLGILQKQKKVILMEELKFQSNSTEIATSDEKVDLLDAIYRLDEKYKTVLLLKYYGDLTFEQIAEILGEPIGTVKSNGKRALEKIKKGLKGAYIDERTKPI
ncbi:sigma-70 family RNA polymerase sigma factor [Lysinibacillus sp. Bpr_S20]|uniref:sigma-70 family RNA polymerase sigma factor n=1 Tax=Lysinibacillus sp. Bpr_S20 TaxID=2933964 RepID=UPI002013392B|nr:sigma-70 family RNA polymerase sigma factor [Lysinibacillus sp. Bpr_S20]MCL1698794.1 sigma-70 family RNA polymerase sigma factor [Lysinibacillus sp. Bpr_S20]